MNKLIFLKVYALVFFFSLAINAQQTVLVHSIQEFNTAVSEAKPGTNIVLANGCLLYTSPSPRDAHESRMPSSA